MSEITLVPVGGLANRMKAIASAMALAERTGSKLRVVWFRDWGLNAPFDQLFEPIGHKLFHLKEATFTDKFLLDRPRNKNLHLPYLYQKSAFQSCLYEREIEPLYLQGFNFEKWIRENDRTYLASYVSFYPYSPESAIKLFVPVEIIRYAVAARTQYFTDRMIGVHIRRTDNTASIERSPIELFYKELDREIIDDARTGIYLATDSEEVKQLMKKRYGDRVLTANSPADRTTLSGIQEGLIDMYTLSRTQKIYGSFHSTFSEMAALVGKIPLEVLKR